MPQIVTLDSAYPANGITEAWADWQNLAIPYRNQGVLRGILNEFAVSQHGGGAMSVDVATGRAYIQGTQCNNGSVKNPTVATSDPTNPRIDRVVLHLDTSVVGPTICADVRTITGTPAPSPVAPGITRSGSVYEISLAQYIVGVGAVVVGNANITDERTWSTQGAWVRTPTMASGTSPTLPTGYLPVEPQYLIIPVSGTTTITQLALPGGATMPAGSRITLEFSGALTVTPTNNLVLPRNYSSSGSPGSTLTLEADGLNNWYEVARAGEVFAQNFALLGPTSGGGIAGPRALVVGDLPTSIPNASLSTDVVRAPNLMVNPGREIWQRGNGPFTAAGAFTSDRHQLQIVGTDSLTSNRDASVQDANSLFSERIDFVLGSGGGQSRVSQTLKPSADKYAMLSAATVTYSCRVKLNIAGSNVVNVAIACDGTGGTTTHSANNVSTTAWQTLSVTMLVPGDATCVEGGVWVVPSNTVWLDNEVLVVGSVAPNYTGLVPGEDLARCQRYYEIIGGDVSGELVLNGYANGAMTAYLYIPYKVPKGGTPTNTKNGTWTVSNCGQPAVDVSGASGLRLNTAVTAAGTFLAHNGAAGCNITSIWSP
jgi:hypothetical protein